MIKVSAKELLVWISKINCEKEDKNALYLLLDLIGGLSKSEIINLKLNPDKQISLKVTLNTLHQHWHDFVITKKPIQYICGCCYWRDLRLKVTKDVLIPRRETEQIVDIVLDYSDNKKSTLIADLGTGSGAIAIALSLESKNFKLLATDINKNSLCIAEENFKMYRAFPNLDFYCGDWWEPLYKFMGDIEIAVCNPPYIPFIVYETLSKTVKNFEPEIALNGGPNGLKHIVKIIKYAPKFLKKGGYLIFENHFDQGKEVKDLLKKNGFNSINNIADYSGVERFTIGRYK